MDRKKIRFIFCSFVPVGLDDYADYMRNRFGDFVYLKWRFHFIDKKRISSSIQIFNKGKLLKEKKLFSFPKINNKTLYFLALPLVYLLYLFQAIKNMIGIRKKHETVIFMGVNYFCTLCGIILKSLSVVDFVIYRVTDFFPLPKSGVYRILNRIFYQLDKISLKYSDAIWFTTNGHIEGREKYGYFKRDNYYYETIPLGLRLDSLISLPLTEVKPHSIVYCGVISRYHLFDMLFNTLKDLKVKYPDIQLNIIGSGPDEMFYKELTTKMNLAENIKFHGFIEDNKMFAKSIAENLIGVALYRDEEDFMKYTEPAKVKTYLGCGVPVIVSNVPRITEEIFQNRVGFSIKNSVNELYNTIECFFNDEEMQKEYRNNIDGYIRRFDIDSLLDRTFNRTFKEIGIE